MIELYTYNAGCGDCFRVRFIGKSGMARNILIDTGTYKFGQDFIKICEDIAKEGERIDYLFLTHVDVDHIGGLLYACRKQAKFFVDHIIMNHPKNIGTVPSGYSHSASQNDEIFNTLKSYGIIGESAIKGDIFQIDGASVSIIAPDKKRLEKVFLDFCEYSYDSGAKKSGDLQELMNEDILQNDSSINNAASIVFVFEYDGNKILFTGDAHSTDILQGINDYSKEKGYITPISFDIVKIPHHGSVGNISEGWAKYIDCHKFIISADGNRHPDKQTIAKLLKWYDKIEIISAQDWWNKGYITQNDAQQYIETDKLVFLKKTDEKIEII